MIRIILLFLILLYVGCTNDNVAGGTDVELGGGYIAGVAYLENGDAVDEVLLIPQNFKPDSSDTTLVKIAEINGGAFCFRGVDSGEYNLLIRGESRDYGVIKRLLVINESDSLNMDSIKVEPVGSIIIKKSELSIPDSGKVVFMGTDIAVTFNSPDSIITLENIPVGEYRNITVKYGQNESTEIGNQLVYSQVKLSYPLNKTLLFIGGVADSFIVESILLGCFKTIKILPPDSVTSEFVVSEDVVCVAPSVDSLPVSESLINTDKPCILIGNRFVIDLKMAALGDTITENGRAVVIDPVHEIIVGETLNDTIDLVDDGSSVSAAVSGTHASTLLESSISDGFGYLFSYNFGDTLVDESSANGKRVYLFTTKSFDNFSSDAIWLYRRTFLWAADELIQ